MKLSRKTNFQNKESKYWSIILVSTVDIVHEDQVSEIVLYIHFDENKTVEIKEAFLGCFVQINKKDVVSLVNKILE